MSVQSEITRLETAKNDISTAIEGKGVTVPAGTKLDGMAALIESIETGGGGEGEDVEYFYLQYTVSWDGYEFDWFEFGVNGVACYPDTLNRVPIPSSLFNSFAFFTGSVADGAALTITGSYEIDWGDGPVVESVGPYCAPIMGAGAFAGLFEFAEPGVVLTFNIICTS